MLIIGDGWGSILNCGLGWLSGVARGDAVTGRKVEKPEKVPGTFNYTLKITQKLFAFPMHTNHHSQDDSFSSPLQAHHPNANLTT